MIALQLRAPEVMDLSINFAKDVHDRPLHVFILALTLVVFLVGRLKPETRSICVQPRELAQS